MDFVKLRDENGECVIAIYMYMINRYIIGFIIYTFIRVNMFSITFIYNKIIQYNEKETNKIKLQYVKGHNWNCLKRGATFTGISKFGYNFT